MKRKIVRGIGTAIIVVAVVAVGAFGFSLLQIQAQVDQNREIALAKAIETAKLYGMETEQPDAFIIKQTTLAEWITITRYRPSTAAVPAPTGRNPDRPIWIVAMVISGTYSAIGIHMVDVNRPLPLGLQRLQ